MMEDNETGESASNNDGERVKVVFLSDSPDEINFHSLDTGDETALVSLMDSLWEKKDQYFLLGCEVETNRIVDLGIVGSCDDRTEFFSAERWILDSGRNIFWHQEFRQSFFDGPYNPRGLVTFSHLKTFALNMPPGPFLSISSWIADKEFPTVTKLCLGDKRIFTLPEIFQPFLSWVAEKNLPKLQQLYIGNRYTMWHCGLDRRTHLEALMHHDVIQCRAVAIENLLALLGKVNNTRLAQKLSSLRMGDEYGLHGNHLETLLIEVLPRLPNLSYIFAHTEATQNMPAVLDNIIRRKASTAAYQNSKLLHADIFPNHFIADPASRPTILRFLECFNMIYEIGTSDFVSPKENFVEFCHPMLLNSVGRRLVQGNSHRNPCLAASVWPIVLEKAQTKANPYFRDRDGQDHPRPKGTRATGIYYLLREGPVLLAPYTMKGTGRTNLSRKNNNKLIRSSTTTKEDQKKRRVISLKKNHHRT